MAFVKVCKNKAYYSRFQTKYRRRRENKTDYKSRRIMVRQEHNKYNQKKYRLVVRFSNKDIVAQITYAQIDGDYVVCAAYAHELTRFGIPVGHTNYAAAYTVGLLIGRRMLQNLKLDKVYEGNTEVDGSEYHVAAVAEGPRPFTCYLDIGLGRATIGSKLFAVMKGASDAGLDIPYSPKRFPGYSKSDPEAYVEVLGSYIYGGHVTEYMEFMQEEDEEMYKKLFSKYHAAGITPDDIEEMYRNAHEQIREDPAMVRTDKVAPAEHYRRPKKLTYDQRKERVMQKKMAILEALNA